MTLATKCFIDMLFVFVVHTMALGFFLYKILQFSRKDNFLLNFALLKLETQ